MPWPSCTIPSSRCSVPIALWLRRRASSWASTTTRRARSVNFSNTTLPSAPGATRLRLDLCLLEAVAQHVGDRGRLVRARLHAHVGERPRADAPLLDGRRVSNIERGVAQPRGADRDVDDVV